MSQNDKLLEMIKSRSGSGRYGYGITTADRYVKDAITTLPKGLALQSFGGPGLGFDNAMKRASQTLAYCGEDTKQERVETNVAAMKKILGCDPPKHAMMAIVNRLTTPREDRDGDTLQTAGANLDPKAPMLWQHLHDMPIGKMMREVEKTKDLLRVASVLLDINQTTHDAGILFEAEALRFSHGFIPMRFEERKGGPMARFNILEFDIVEESAVSVPSNVDAEVELFCRGKLASDVFKAHAKSLFEARNKSMPVGGKAKAIFQKYNPDQPRDENGRFGEGAGGSAPDRGDGSGAGGSGGRQTSVAKADSGDVQKALRPAKVREVLSQAEIHDTVHAVEVGGGDIVGTVAGINYDDDAGDNKWDSVAEVTIDKDGELHQLSVYEGKYSSIEVFRGKKALQRSMRKMFDVATERLEPCTQEQDWAARYIGCNVKDMSTHETSASGMMIGAFLAGLDVVTQGKYKVTDTRNMKGGGEEAPPVHEVIEIKSDEKRTFLVEGIRFGTASDHRIVWRTWQGWGGQHLLVYTDNDKFAHDLIDKVWEWVERNNPLKGQAFALAGGWISKTGTAWDDVFLEPEIEAALKRTVRIINEKGAEAANRGQVLSGPPGTGKTLSARVMLNEADCTFIWVSAKDFWKLGSYQAFAGAFALARSLAPSIICFEDVDNWIDSYTVDLLKGEMDGLQQSTGVTTLLTTNFPDQLPAALIDRPGRFHDVLEIHLPSKEVRLRMLQKWAPDGSLDALATMATDTEDYSGAHIYELCHFARVIRDEEECSADEALTKAFAKVKDQRDLINQNQLAGSSYRPGRREFEAMIAKGWRGKAAAMITKSDGAITGGQIGPVPNDGEAQDAFMVRCMLDPTMMGDYPTEADRTAACSVQWGKGSKPTTKAKDGEADMGECKECGKKAKLNGDGMCAECAGKDEKPEGKPSGSDKPAADAPPFPPPKGTKPRAKAGRVLSQRNMDALGDVMADLEECSNMDMPRAAKAMVRGCVVKIKSVIDAATPESDDDTVEKQPVTVEQIFSDAVRIVGEDRALRDRMRKLLDTFDKSDEYEQVGEDFERLVSSSG